MGSFRNVHRRLAGSLVLLAAFAAAGAAAQPHVAESGDYVLRASTVSTHNLPQQMLEKHGIAADPRKAVLNVTVHRKGAAAGPNLAAQVTAQARNVGGIETAVTMRKVVADGFVTYLGVYDFLPREVLDFRVTARPEGSTETLELEFRDRLGRR
ncbi:DUF4426 domain-containing protein [Piscinibacter sp.]|uniref:DUF4426 domain-containing protein n=1 Tax=Piscinibacter sp. TaxID=1903157 RepID=UPI002C417536|nr:DUF4426 domain-containing protein [Albitalea sp.]HUG20987.1 DUF4426 domain-containing protein [Albitalea sp.]